MKKPRLVVAAASLLMTAQGAMAADKAADAPLAETPPDITLVDVTNSSEQFLWRRLGDATGKPLYTYDQDTSGKATCTGECAREFQPLLAAKGAVAMGDWSLIAADGGKQWAYQGHALYRFTGQETGEATGGRRGRGGGEEALADPASKVNSPKDGWRRAAFAPQLSVPAGISLRSMAVADGYGFVVANTGMPIYVLGTAPKAANAWTPVYAPGMAQPIGDFTIKTREDGRRQWAYKDRLLYTFNEDYSPSDLNGVLAQKDAKPALAYRHFIPDGVTIETLPTRGPLMVTSKGMTLYTQSRYHLQYGGRETRDGYRYSYADAKAVGTKGCVQECTKVWKPYLAPANAKPSGFWEIEIRDDGTRQWSYKGSPLYTYAGDKKPGDIEGNNQHVIIYGDPDGKTDLSLTGGDRVDSRGTAGSGFYWHVAGLYN